MLKTSLPDLEAMKNSYKLRSDNLRTLIFDGTNTAESSQFHVQRPTVQTSIEGKQSGSKEKEDTQRGRYQTHQDTDRMIDASQRNKKGLLESPILGNAPVVVAEQVCINPFGKTKQLFKNRNTSLLLDDLTNSNVFTAPKEEHLSLVTERIFEFDSFGKHDHELALPKQNFLVDDKGWNSASMQMDFCKLNTEQKNADVKWKHQKHLAALAKIENSLESASGIKQFCFNLQEATIPLSPLPKTTTSQSNKTILKKLLFEYIDQLDQLPNQQITSKLIADVKKVLSLDESSKQLSSMVKKGLTELHRPYHRGSQNEISVGQSQNMCRQTSRKDLSIRSTISRDLKRNIKDTSLSKVSTKLFETNKGQRQVNNAKTVKDSKAPNKANRASKFR